MLVINSFITLRQKYGTMEATHSLDAIIELHNCQIWQQDHLVLKNVDLTVNRGEFMYLVGKVGSGKTSLIKTINAQLPLKEGTGLVAGYNLSKLRERDIPHLRRKLGIVFQDFQLLIDRTVNENLEFVLKATGWKSKVDIKERIDEVLDKVGMGLKGYKMPHQLSGGEQQRVVIARALLNDPEIILADEPTGNLDPETSEGIINLLLEISKTGRAVVITTHNQTILRKFPARTLKCEDGKLLPIEKEEEIELI